MLRIEVTADTAKDVVQQYLNLATFLALGANQQPHIESAAGEIEDDRKPELTADPAADTKAPRKRRTKAEIAADLAAEVAAKNVEKSDNSEPTPLEQKIAEVKAEEAPQPETPPAETKPVEPMKIDDLRSFIVSQYLNEFFPADARGGEFQKLLKHFEVGKLGDLPAEKYADMKAHVEERIGAETAKRAA